MKVTADPNIIIKHLFQRKIGEDSFRSYLTVQANGRYQSLVGREEWAAKSCRDARVGRSGDYDVAVHADFDARRRLFGEVIVLQAEFAPRPEQPPLFYLRNDAVIEPYSGKLHLVFSEDYRRPGPGGFTYDKNLWGLYDNGFFENLFPHLQKMFSTFKSIAGAEEGFARFWGMKNPSSWRWKETDEADSVRPIVDLPFAPVGGAIPEPEAVVARLGGIGERRMTRAMAQELFGVSGSGNLQSSEVISLRRQVVNLIHPDRNKSPDVELWLKQLNSAFDLLKN